MKNLKQEEKAILIMSGSVDKKIAELLSQKWFSTCLLQGICKRNKNIGCGSVGSNIAQTLARCGVTNMTLWDFDDVETKNIVNQDYFEDDIGSPN